MSDSIKKIKEFNTNVALNGHDFVFIVVTAVVALLALLKGSETFTCYYYYYARRRRINAKS